VIATGTDKGELVRHDYRDAMQKIYPTHCHPGHQRSDDGLLSAWGPAEVSLAEVEASEVIPVYTTRVAGAELGFGGRRDGSLPTSFLDGRRSRQDSNFSRLPSLPWLEASHLK
jgi:hypothetical protein